MEFTKLGNTNIKVSRICLGTMTWGEQNTEAEAHQQLDYAVDAGINFIDTAEMYPVPPTEATQGLTETYIGTWLAKRLDRDRLIIASKVCGNESFVDYMREGEIKLDKRNIHQAIDATLKRLQTDYIDLYQVHWPDRDTNYFGNLGYYHAPEKDGIAIAETLDVLGGLVKDGKIRMVGISNETPWGCAEYLRVSKEQGLPRIISIQNPYNLLNRSFEIGLSEFAHREQTGLLAYSPLAFGVLSGKFLNGARPIGTRLVLWDRFSRYSSPQADVATEAYVKLAHENDLDPAQMALAFVNSRPFLTSNIIGATSMKQLRSNIESINLKLPKRIIKAIEAIHEKIPNPSP